MNQRNTGVRFSVIDKGKSAIDTNFLLNRVESYLTEYHPDMVVAMMGMNDQGVKYYEDIPESDTWLFRHCRTYRFGRILCMHLLKKLLEKDVYGSDRADGRRKSKLNGKGTAIEKANLSNGTSKEKMTRSDLNDAKRTPGPSSSYLNGGRISKTEESFKKAIELDPENDKAYVEMGQLYRERGEFPQAEDFLGKAILLDPGNDKAYAELEKLYRLQSRVFQAEDFFKKAIELDPKSANAYVGLGRCYLLQEKFSLAEDSFEKTIEIDPKNANAYVGFGWLDRFQDKFPQAEDSFKKAIELDPENANAYVGLGWLYRFLDKSSQAEASFKKAIELNPEYARAYTELGQLHQERGQFQQAEDFFWEAIKLDPENQNAYLPLGGLYRLQDKFSEAEDVFKKAIAINPENDRILGAMALLCKEIGKPELAKEYAKKVNELRSEYYAPVTVNNYRKLKEILDKKSIQLVCVQYPVRNVEPLKRIFAKDKGVFFVDNERVFKEAIKQSGYNEYFRDMFGGDFGHCTPKGNMLLAQNIADMILREVFNKR
ncbi:MAG: tetratricopeptide repeat protein [Candidatus Omnitrophota bacterium]